MLNKVLGAAAASLALVAGGAHADLVIDKFTVGQSVAVTFDSGAANGVWTHSTAGNASIIGGQRDIYVEKSAGPGFVSGLVDTTLNTFNFSQDTNTAGFAKLRYDGSNTGAAIATGGLGSQDFTAFGTGITFTFKSDSNFIDPGTTPLVTPYVIKIQVWGDNGIEFNEIEQIAYGTFGNYVVDSILFTELGWSNAAFSWDKVSALQIMFNVGSTAAIDVDISITAPTAVVPEPMALALVGIGLLGVAASRRRRQA